MNEQQQDAIGSVTAYLDTRDALIAAGADLTDQIAEGKSGGLPWARLLASHLREVLRHLADAKIEAFEQRNLAENSYADTVKALQGWDQALLERDEARAEVERLTRQLGAARDGDEAAGKAAPDAASSPERDREAIDD